MRLFAIATLREYRQGEILGYRVLNFDTGEKRIMYIPEFESILKAHKEWLINVDKATIQKLPRISLNGKCVSATTHLLIARNIKTGQLITSSYTGSVATRTFKDLYSMTLVNEFVNIEFVGIIDRDNINDDNLSIRGNILELTENPLVLKENMEFREKIDAEYVKYIAKAKLLGLDMRFKYTTIGNTVTLEKYTGKSTKVIIPSFVNIIGRNAFFKLGFYIEELHLTHGLREIKGNAFDGNDIGEVDIPDTVEVIEGLAFNNNKQLFEKQEDDDGNVVYYEMDRSKLRIANRNTIVEKQCTVLSGLFN